MRLREQRWKLELQVLNYRPAGRPTARSLARLGRFIVTINRGREAPSGFPNLVVDDDVETRRGTHLNFPGKDTHRVHFNPPGTPRRNMVDGEGERERPRERKKERYEERRGGEALRLRVRGWWFKSERPVSRARPKREQLIVMCSGRRSILISPLKAPRTRVPSHSTEGPTKKEARRRVVTRTRHRSYSGTRGALDFFTSFLSAEDGRCRRRRGHWSGGTVKSISETVFEVTPHVRPFVCLAARLLSRDLR